MGRVGRMETLQGNEVEEKRLLTVEEVLLLVNLMYLPQKESGGLKPLGHYEGKRVGELVGDAVLGLKAGRQEAPDGGFGICMTGVEWRNLLYAIRKNECLMQVLVEVVFCDVTQGGGGGLSALFLNPHSGEAVVAFRGTAQGEWKDNFLGGCNTKAPDRVSTRQQLRALEWYQSLELEPYFVTAAGHSKGGNKAKYITILDDSVDRCLSFDGQGFSDEFMDWYYARVYMRQKVVENHNVGNDYVNLLLNRVGKTFWYQGRDYGKGGFLKNHCPNAFFEFTEDGGCRMKESEAGLVRALQHIEDFLTDFLRSLSAREKYDILDLAGTLAQEFADGAPKEAVLLGLLDERNRDAALNLAEYSLSYEKEHPDFGKAAGWVFEQAGMDGLIWAVRMVRTIRSIPLKSRHG